MDNFAAALTSATRAEIEALGEEVTFQGLVTKCLVGTSKEVKAMEAAGYLQNEGLTIVMLPAEALGLPDNPTVNDTVYLRESNWRIHQVDAYEYKHAFTLTLEKMQ
jgi:hypothetical protein